MERSSNDLNVAGLHATHSSFGVRHLGRDNMMLLGPANMSLVNCMLMCCLARHSVLKMCGCWVQAASSGWGAEFLKKNKDSVATANAAVAAAIEEQKGPTTGRLMWPQHSTFLSKSVLPKPLCHVSEGTSLSEESCADQY